MKRTTKPLSMWAIRADNRPKNCRPWMIDRVFRTRRDALDWMLDQWLWSTSGKTRSANLRELRRDGFSVVRVTVYEEIEKPHRERAEAAERRVGELERALRSIGEYTGNGPHTTPWQDIVRDVGAAARAALTSSGKGAADG